MLNSVLLEPLVFSFPKLTAFFLFNSFLSFVALIFALSILYFNKFLFVRPAYYSAVGWLFLYQIPVSIFSSEFLASLEHAWKWSIVIHVVSFSLLGWCALVSSRPGVGNQSFGFPFPSLSFYERWFPVGLLMLMVAIYFYVVPYDCTGLYALWADPWMTLLAREFSIKLIGSSLATYALGAAANIISPLVVAFSIFHAKKYLFQREYVYFLMWLGIGILSIILVLTSGAKGLLVPTLLMAAVVSLLWGANWISRGIMLVASVGLIASTMVFFELARERDGVAGARYDFAQCSFETNACVQSLSLLNSLGYREGSLGLSTLLTGQIKDRLSCMCSSQGGGVQCPTVGVPAYRPKQVDRAATLFQAILNRAFAVPFQVGVWHLMYAESEHVDGWRTLPFSNRFFGESLNMPELVYQKYGTIYSKGDRTSTSTAPTSFILSYPAYLGLVGLFISLGCLIVWDFIYVFFAFHLRKALLPIAGGMAAITSMNFMSSDFMTVLISHGGGVSLLVILLFVLLKFHSNGNK